MPPVWRSAELEALLGVLSQDALSEAVFQQLCDTGTRENEQLDFKAGNSYPAGGYKRDATWSVGQELAKDVVAFANHRGGVLLRGISETDKKVASALDPVQGEPGAEEQRIRAYIAQNAWPAVSISIIAVPASQGGFYQLIVVPPSPFTVHYVYSPTHAKHLQCYPVRDGQDTRWLNPHEVESRRRAAGQTARQYGGITPALTSGTRHLRRAQDSTQTGLWLYVVAAAEAPLQTRLSLADKPQIVDWYFKNLLPNAGIFAPLPYRADARAVPGGLVFTDDIQGKA
jgi:hypothetical protein